MTPMVDYYPMRRLSGARREHDRTVTTICRECGVGCGICAYVSEGRVVDIQGDEDNPVNKGRLCPYGSAFLRELYSPNRITRPAGRKSLRDGFEDLEDWEQALDTLADRLKKIRDQHGPEALLIECAPAAGLDFYYPAMRFAALWKTLSVFSSADEPRSSNTTGAPNAPDCGCRDWLQNRCFLIVAADPASTHTIAFRQVLEAQKNGAKVIVADTRFTKTMSKADLALRIKADTANSLGTTLMKAILDDDLCSTETIRDRFKSAESWLESFEKMSLDIAAERVGLSLSNLKQAASLLGKKGPAQVITGKRLAQAPDYGIWRTMCVAMGWTGENGGGWYPLDSGTPPLAWGSDLDEADSAGISLSPETDSPRSISGYVKGVAKGEIQLPKAIIASGDLPADFCQLLEQTGEDAPLTAYFGHISNETANLSHLLFPAQAWSERESLSFSNDRAIHLGAKIVDPPETAKTGLDFWIGLAKRFGWANSFPWLSEDGSAKHEDFYDWLLNQSPLTKGCTVEILRGAGEFVHWPFDSKSPRRPAPAPLIGRAEKITPVHAGACERASEESDEPYPLRLECPDPHSTRMIAVDGAPLNNGPVAQINPDIALVLGIETGDEIVIQAPGRSTEARAWITRMVPRWSVYFQRGTVEERVLVHKKGQPSQEALSILGKLLS